MRLDRPAKRSSNRTAAESSLELSAGAIFRRVFRAAPLEIAAAAILFLLCIVPSALGVVGIASGTTRPIVRTVAGAALFVVAGLSLTPAARRHARSSVGRVARGIADGASDEPCDPDEPKFEQLRRGLFASGCRLHVAVACFGALLMVFGLSELAWGGSLGLPALGPGARLILVGAAIVIALGIHFDVPRSVRRFVSAGVRPHDPGATSGASERD